MSEFFSCSLKLSLMETDRSISELIMKMLTVLIVSYFNLTYALNSALKLQTAHTGVSNERNGNLKPP